MKTSVKNKSLKKREIPVNILKKSGINVFINNVSSKSIENKDNTPIKKIIIFDIAPINDSAIKELSNKKIVSFLKKIDSNVILVFSSIMSYESMQKLLIGSFKLTSGFIISNNGARIYDIANKNFIFQQTLSDDQKNMVVHNAYVFGCYVLGSTQAQNLAYFSNYLDANEFNKISYINYAFTTNYSIYNSYITSNNFLSFLCYENDVNVLKTKRKQLKKVEKEWKLNISDINNNMFIVTAEGINKLNSIYQLISCLKFVNFEEIYYFAINDFDQSCWNAFSKNHYININLYVNTKNKTKIEESFHLPSLITALSRLIKFNQSDNNSLTFKNFFSGSRKESTFNLESTANKAK